MVGAFVHACILPTYFWSEGVLRVVLAEVVRGYRSDGTSHAYLGPNISIIHTLRELLNGMSRIEGHHEVSVPVLCLSSSRSICGGITCCKQTQPPAC